jgi:GT2 family glycosyltransferase
MSETNSQQSLSPSLSIIIPTYNALGIVEPLLNQLVALAQVQTGEYEVIISDDASSDGTVAILRQQYPQFTYLESASNTGYGPNCNRGIAAAAKAYCAVVNSDIELEGNPFAPLLEDLRVETDCFALMPLIWNTARQEIENLQELRPSRGLLWNANLPHQAVFTQLLQERMAQGIKGDQLLDGLPHGGHVGSILCGACFVAPTQSLREVGGFDPRFTPCYWEDVDLGLAGCNLVGKLTKQPVGACAGALVYHRHSETINKTHGDRKLHFLRLNQLRFLIKWEPQVFVPFVRFWWLLRGIRESLGGDKALCTAYLKAAFGARTV